MVLSTFLLDTWGTGVAGDRLCDIGNGAGGQDDSNGTCGKELQPSRTE